MKKFFGKYIFALAIIVLCAAFTTLWAFGAGDFKAPSTYYQTGEMSGDYANEALCYDISYKDEEGVVQYKLDSVWVNFGGAEYFADGAVTFKALMANGVSSSFSTVNTVTLASYGSADKIGRWTLLCSPENLSGFSTRTYFLLLTDGGEAVKINEIAFVGKQTGADAYTLLSATAIGSGAKSSATASLDGSGEFDRGETGVARAQKLIDEQGKFSVREIIREGESADLSYNNGASFYESEVYLLDSVRNIMSGKGYYIDKTVNPLGQFIIAIGTGVFGYTTVGLRFIPLLFSLATMIALFYLGKFAFGKKGWGLLLAALYFIGGYALSLSSVGGATVIWTFFAVMSFYFFFGFYKKGISGKNPKISYLKLLLAGGFFALAFGVSSKAVYILPALFIVLVAGIIRQYKAYAVKRSRATAENAVTLKSAYVNKLTNTLVFAVIGIVLLPLVVIILSFLCAHPSYATMTGKEDAFAYAFDILRQSFYAVNRTTFDSVNTVSVWGWPINYGAQKFAVGRFAFGNMIISFTQTFAVIYGICFIILGMTEKGFSGFGKEEKSLFVMPFIFGAVSVLSLWFMSHIGKSSGISDFYPASVFGAFVLVAMFARLDGESVKPLFKVGKADITIVRLIGGIVLLGAVVAFALAVPAFTGLAANGGLYYWNVLTGTAFGV